MGTRQTVATKSDCASQYRDHPGAVAPDSSTTVGLSTYRRSRSGSVGLARPSP